MAGETQESDVIEQPGSTDEDAAMLLGFNTAMGEPSADEAPAGAAPKADTQKTDGVDHDQHGAEQAARAQAEAEAAAAAAVEAERNAPVTLTRAQMDDINARLAKIDAIDALTADLNTTREKLHGRMGNIQQAVDAVRTQLAGGQKASAVQLAKVREVYPDLAELLEQDLGAGAPAPAPAPDTTGAAPDPKVEDDNASGQAPGADSAPDPLQDPRVKEQLAQLEARERAAHGAAVIVAHPDWKDVVKTPEFATWRSLLNPEAQAKLANTWDSQELIPAFAAFKDWRGKQQAASKQRDKRLEDAMPATSGAATGAHAPQDEDAAMMVGFNAARGVR